MMRRLTKAERAALADKFGGRCAYCGELLGARWHADHMEAVYRKAIIQEGRYVQTGEAYRPEHDTIENMMPSCPPCNIDKSVYSVEQWREKLHRSVEVLERNHSVFRHARRFGLVQEVKKPVVFHFEAVAAAIAA